MVGRRTAAGLTAAALACSGLVLGATPSGAATFEVTSGADDGSEGTFRWAVDQALASSGADVVGIDAAVGTITLDDCVDGRVDLVGADPLTIEGGGTTIVQTCDDGVLGGVGFAGLLTVQNVTITGGDAPGSGGGIGLVDGDLVLDRVELVANRAAGMGGGLFVWAGNVDITNSSVTGNTSAQDGGGVFIGDDATLEVLQSTVSGNDATTGGGVAARGSSYVADSTVEDNTAGTGGGIAAEGGTSLSGTTVRGNVAVSGGGVVVDGGALGVFGSTIVDNESSTGAGGLTGSQGVTVDASTVRGNRSASGTGGIDGGDVRVTGSAITGNVGEVVGGVNGSSSVTVVSTTVSGNTGSLTAGVGSAGPVVLEFATIVGNEVGANALTSDVIRSFASILGEGGPACGLLITGTIVSEGYNVAGGGSCAFSQPSDLNGVDELLLSDLADHDGATANHVPLSGSPALEKVPSSDPRCAGTDQRGFARPANGTCDSGAVEVRQVSAVSSAVTTPFQTAVVTDLVPLVTDPDGVLAQYEVEGASHGQLDAADGGQVTYLPDAGFAGADSYSYVVCSISDVICTTPQAISITVGAGPVVPATPIAVTPSFTG